MTIELHHIDAFTDRPFGGNPAAVCLPADTLDDSTMQALSAEMNLSETAFVSNGVNAPTQPRADSDHTQFGLRWFTPAAEVELCGHATLASAHLLWEHGWASPDLPIDFHTHFAGTLRCQREADGLIGMQFPADPPSTATMPVGLLQRLGLQANQVREVVRGKYDLVLELTDEAAVRELMPEFTALAEYDVRGIAVTAAASRSSDIDVVSRLFAPRLRINEDPVTGSLHCLLGPYWSAKLGQSQLRCEQASARGGMVRVRTEDVPSQGTDTARVHLSGQAVTVAEGQLVISRGIRV